MTLDEKIVDALRALPADQPQEALNHAKHLRVEVSQARPPRESVRVLWPI
jgi:hypothetical protein